MYSRIRLIYHIIIRPLNDKFAMKSENIPHERIERIVNSFVLQLIFKRTAFIILLFHAEMTNFIYLIQKDARPFPSNAMTSNSGD